MECHHSRVWAINGFPDPEGIKNILNVYEWMGRLKCGRTTFDDEE